MSTPPTPSETHHHDELLVKIKEIIPHLDDSKHKGEVGRIGIVGGSSNYTGAPYFAAISALKSGADLSHVFCMNDAANVIKSYSPELIVHPLLDKANAVEEMNIWLNRLHAMVLGPGLGRDPYVFDTLGELSTRLQYLKIPLVVDADALFYFTDNYEKICSYRRAILTPNEIEFSRLARTVIKKDSVLNNPMQTSAVKDLAAHLGNVTVCRKGHNDVISDGKCLVVCRAEGSLRRCGGQGDVLAGIMGTFLNWAIKHQSTSPALNISAATEPDDDTSPIPPTVLAAYAACLLTRESSRLAFAKYRRATVTGDMIAEIGTAFNNLFGQ